MMIPEPGPRVAEDALERRSRLPLKPAPVHMAGQLVELVPLETEHVEGLFAVSNGSPVELGERSVPAYDPERLIWRFMRGGPFAGLDAFRRYCEEDQRAPDGLALCVLGLPTRQPIGMTNFMNNSPGHLKIELGGIWYSPVAQGTAANTEATYLMLGHCFGLGYRRVEWKCDALNERSRRAALRIGFRFEGVQQQHMIVKGRSRDTAWYRMLADEWPDAERRLREAL